MFFIILVIIAVVISIGIAIDERHIGAGFGSAILSCIILSLIALVLSALAFGLGFLTYTEKKISFQEPINSIKLIEDQKVLINEIKIYDINEFKIKRGDENKVEIVSNVITKSYLVPWGKGLERFKNKNIYLKEPKITFEP